MKVNIAQKFKKNLQKKRWGIPHRAENNEIKKKKHGKHVLIPKQSLKNINYEQKEGKLGNKFLRNPGDSKINNS